MAWLDTALEKFQRWGARLRLFGSLNLLDFSMWLGWLFVGFLCFVGMALELGPQLALFYTSPLWLTLLVGWLGFRPLAMVVYTIVIFVVVQSFLQSYPVRCRELWKEKLMFDSTWTDERAFDALNADRKNLMPGAGKDELKKWAKIAFRHTKKITKHVKNLGEDAADYLPAAPASGSIFASAVHRRLDAADAAAATELGPASGFGAAASAVAKGGAAGAGPAVEHPWWLSTNTTAAVSTTGPPAANQTTSRGLADFEPRFPDIDSVGDLELKIYCSMHRAMAAKTENTSKFFPCCAYIFAPGDGSGFFEDLFRYFLEKDCHPWTCTFTEQHSHGGWQFMMMPGLCVAVTIVHFMCRGYRLLEILLGAGQIRTWWAWFWAAFLPIWSAMYVVYIKDFSIGDLIEWTWDHTLYVLADIRALVIIVGIFLLGLLVQTNKDRIYQVLGIDDHRVIHWINTQRSNRTVAHAFQVCIWRIDVNAIASIEQFNDWEISAEINPQLGDQGDFDTEAQGRWFPGLGKAFTGGYRTLSMRTPATRHRETFGQRGKKTLRVSGGHAPAMFVRLAYGHNEIQNTRVQRLVRPLADNGVCYFQENFRLIQEPDDDTCLFIEVRDQTLVGAHDLGRVHFDGEGLQRQFDRASRQGELLRRKGTGIQSEDMASEQIVRMMQLRAENNRWNENKEGEEMRHKMWEAGFAPHPLSEGGAIWLAMYDLGPDGPSGGDGCAVS